MSVAALIPALDCERSIGDVVAGARRHLSFVLVVDDGSVDRTAEIAREAGAEVISRAATGGKGAALLLGMRRLAELGFERVVTLDGDGQHLPSEIPAVLAESERYPSAIVLGARRIEEAEVAPIRLFGNRFANRWVEIASGLRVADSQSGFRVYPLRETLAIGARAPRFEYETEVLILAARRGIRVRSVPVAVHYPPPEERTSHYRSFADTVRIIRVVLGLIFRLR